MRQLLCAVVALATLFAAPSWAQERSQLTLERELVVVDVNVFDPFGRAVAGLERGDFEVLDEGIPREIAFFSAEDAPATIGVVLDVSESMSADFIASLDAIKRMRDTRVRDDEYFLVTVSSAPRLAVDMTTSLDEIVEGLRNAKTQGRTSLIDGVLLGLETCRRGRHERRALIVISDGYENNSRYTQSDLQERIDETGVLVYHLNNFGPFSVGHGGPRLDRRDPVHIAYAFQEIALQLRCVYSIGFYPPPEARDGRRHELKVRVRRPAGSPPLGVRARSGYQAGQP